MIWQQLKIQTDEQHTDLLNELLFAQGAVSVTFEDAADAPIYEPLPGTTPHWQHTLVVGLFEESADLHAVLNAMQLGSDENIIQNYTIEQLPDQQWELAWKEHFHPMRFGKSLWVCPADETIDDPNATCVMLEPGLGFGTGTHTSTALCLEWLDENPPHNKSVLDYGSGSGILSIAAIKLGATHVWAIDIDPQAVEATHNNATRNHLSLSQIDATLPEDNAFKNFISNHPVDVIISNIMAYPLIDLAPQFATFLKPGGQVVLSGILSEQTDRIQKAYGVDFSLVSEKILDGWARLEFKRNG